MNKKEGRDIIRAAQEQSPPRLPAPMSHGWEITSLQESLKETSGKAQDKQKTIHYPLVPSNKAPAFLGNVRIVFSLFCLVLSSPESFLVHRSYRKPFVKIVFMGEWWPKRG